MILEGKIIILIERGILEVYISFRGDFVMRKIIYFISIIIISISIMFLCNLKVYNINDKELVYYKPKLYPVLDENYPPYRLDSKPIENPQVRLLSETDKGIIFEMIDSTFPNPAVKASNYKDTFYCILTDNRELKYFNGYIDYIYQGMYDDEKNNELGLSEFIKREGNDVWCSSNVFSFRELHREYNIKLTENQYKKIIDKLEDIDKNFKTRAHEEFSIIADRYIYRGVCFKSGYFDAKDEMVTPVLKNIKGTDKKRLQEESFEEFYDKYEDLYIYVQSLIPHLETYRFVRQAREVRG